jgi:hypothetical protein
MEHHLAVVQRTRGHGQSKVDHLLAYLVGRRAGIETRLLCCIEEIEAPPRSEDRPYRLATRALIGAVLDAALAAYAQAAERPRMLRAALCASAGDGGSVLEDADALVPQIVREQAARAARAGIGADTLIRRMLAGSRVMQTVLAEALFEARIGEGSALAYSLRCAQSELLEALSAAITFEHARACGRHAPLGEAGRLALIERLLAGEAVDEEELCYSLESANHVALVGVLEQDRMRSTTQALSSVADALALSLIYCSPERGLLWAWFGASREIGEAQLLARLARISGEPRLLVGPAQRGAQGFCASHELACQARRIAPLRSERILPARSVLLSIAVAQQPIYGRCLIDAYLAPLDALPVGGERLRASLRAYLDCAQHASSAAKTLGISRRTIERHLRTIEGALGQPLGRCMPELAAALEFERLLAHEQPGDMR